MTIRDQYLNRNRFWAAVLLALMLAGPACSLLRGNPTTQIQPNQSAIDSSEDQTTLPTVALTQEPALASPIQVTVTLEEDRVAQADVNDEGGEVSAASSSGVEYHLSVPPGALPDNYQIRMTPIKSMEGLPLSGGLLGAVHLGPEGLVLLQPAVLTVSLPEGTPPEEVVAFAYQGNGEHTHLYPASIEGNMLTFQISHFSGYGGGRGSPGETSGWPPTGDPNADYEQQAADYMRKHPNGQNDDAFIKLLRQWFNEVIYPALKAAEKDDATLDAAGAAFLDWAGQVSLMSLNEYLGKELKDGSTSLLKGLANSVDQSYRRCMQVNAYQASKMLRRLREIALLNGLYGGTAPQGYTLEDKKPELQSCLTFKLKLDSLVTWLALDGEMKISTQVVGEVILRLNPETWSVDGSGTVETRQYSVEFFGDMSECAATPGEGQSASLDIEKALITWEGEDENTATPTVKIWLQPGMVMSGEMPGHCGDAPDVPVKSVPTWTGGFVMAHEDRKTDLGYIFTEFDKGGGQLFARLSMTEEKSMEGATVTDDLTLDLLHTPGE